MKWVKAVGVFLLILFLVNAVTWLAVGREQALLLAERDFDGHGSLDGQETLHLYANYEQDPPKEWRGPGAFSEPTRTQLRTAFIESGRARAVQYHDQTLDDPFQDSLQQDHLVLWAAVRSRAPLHAEVASAVVVPGFVSSRRVHWIWLFGWRHTGFSRSGVT